MFVRMKTFVAIYLLLFLSNRYCHAQIQYTPSIAFNIKSHINYSYHDIDTQNNIDQIGTSNGAIGRTANFERGKQSNITMDGDTISLTYSFNSNMGTPQIFLISLVFDSSKSILKAASLRYEGDYYASLRTESDVEYLSFSNLNSKSIDSGIFKVMDSGAQARIHLDSCYYHYNNYINYGPGSYASSTNEYLSIFEDTASFIFELSLNLFAPDLGTDMGNTYVPGSLRSITIFPPNRLRFEFPPSPESRPLIIYDILGRECKLLPISSDVTETECNAPPPGTYFARLGNLTTSFIVP